MKKLMVLFGAIFFASCIFTSCGGVKSNNELSIKLNQPTIQGGLSDFYEVVDRTYKIEKEYYKDSLESLKIKIQIKKKAQVFDVKSNFNIFCELLDENQTPIGSKSEISYNCSYGSLNDSQITEMIALKPNESSWIEFRFVTYDITKDEIDKVKSFNVSSIVNKSEESSSSSSISSENESSSITSVDCDKFIKDYEAFADSYIKLLKKYKANPTDATILSEYTEAAQKAAELQTDASNCTDTKYATKLLEIASKIAKAVM